MAALGMGRIPTARRSTQLDRCRHIVAIRDQTPAGFAAFELTDDRDLLVHELATPVDDDNDAIGALVSALELACLAAGGTRLLISSRIAVLPKKLEPFGYEQAPWSGWLEKRVCDR